MLRKGDANARKMPIDRRSHVIAEDDKDNWMRRLNSIVSIDNQNKFPVFVITIYPKSLGKDCYRI